MDSAKRTAELVLPGCAIGVLAAFVVGGVALVGGLPTGYAVVAALALGVPLSLFGAGYSLLLAGGRIRLGGIAPAVGYWLVGYTVSRVVHEVSLDAFLGRPFSFTGGLLSFLVFQVLISIGFAIGFIWLHEHTAPLWWLRIRDRNPVAAAYVAVYMEQAVRMKRQKEEQERKRKERGRGRERIPRLARKNHKSRASP